MLIKIRVHLRSEGFDFSIWLCLKQFLSTKDLKRELLQYLANRDCLMLFPGFLSGSVHAAKCTMAIWVSPSTLIYGLFCGQIHDYELDVGRILYFQSDPFYMEEDISIFRGKDAWQLSI